HFLLSVARSAFDITVIEVNAYWDNAATLCGLQEADYRIWVCTDRLGSFQEDYGAWAERLLPVLKLPEDAAGLFITQQRKSSLAGKYSVKEIQGLSGLDVIGKLPQDDTISLMLDQGRLGELVQSYR